VRPELFPEKGIVRHEKPRSHTTFSVMEFLKKNSIVVLEHTAYSPDFIPCDFFLFHKMKKKNNI
jgi:hypothetical protein